MIDKDTQELIKTFDEKISEARDQIVHYVLAKGEFRRENNDLDYNDCVKHINIWNARKVAFTEAKNDVTRLLTA